MALLIGDNFSYNGKKPNFERDSFETLAILKAFPEANIDNGHIVYCKETKKHYIFDDTNTIDETTGKWRELESEFINKVNISDLDNYVTDTELQEAISGVQFELPIASDSILGGIKVGAGLSINPDTGVLSATGGGTADAIDWTNVTSKPQINGHELIGGNNTLDSLGIQPAGNYAIKSEIPSLSGYATQSWVQEQGYLTSIPDNYITEEELNDKGYLTQVPDEYITETKLNAKGYLTQIPEEYITETELTEAIADIKYTLPIASADVLGGIKVGAGLSINAETGVLSVTGGGTADSVDWNNVLSKPEWITNSKPIYNYTEIEGNIPTSKLPIATTTSVGAIKVGSGLTIDGEGLLSATGGSGSEITDVSDDKLYARTQGSWKDLTDWLAWAELD